MKTMSPEDWRRIEQVCQAALDELPERRTLLLDQACAGDLSLRREVESLIFAYEKTAGFLSLSALQMEACAMARDRDRINPGARLGHYEIQSILGVGGMGEVYLARDVKLGRRAAIKLLPPLPMQAEEDLMRFEQEAKAVSALNHPNIMTIYEFGENGALHYLAAEFIDGMTLRRRLENGPISFEEALEISLQITSALDAAHTAGIVHRDIKPENVMVRPDGLVKVLDFGLAKFLGEPALVNERLETDDDWTLNLRRGWSVSKNHHLTRANAILGTPSYMSPEQAQGKSADERSDLFSFGVVLYEMISGQAPFTGGTLLQLLFAVINGEPEPVSELRFDLPKERGELDRIIKRMLAKNPNDRYQKSSELRDDLLKLKRRLEDRKRSLSAPAWRWAALLGAALIIFLIVRDFQQRRAATLRANNPVVNVRSDQRITSLIDRENWAGGGIRRFSVSTDGKWLAYDMGEESGSAIWIKSLDGAAELQITDGRRRDRDPIWSLDGKSLAFSSDREGRSAIWQIDVGDMLGRQAERPAGGQAGENKPAPEALVEIDLGDARLINWSRDGKAIYYESRGDLMALDAATGQSSKLTNFASANQRVNGFSVSPDEKFLAYEQADSPGGQTHLFVSSLGGDQPRQISFGEGNDQSPNWFPDGRTIAYRSNRSGRYQIYLVEMRDLETRRITSSESHYEFFTVSPDGEKIVYLFQKETGNISICDIQTKRETEQTSDGKLNRWPEISADGEWLAYQTLEANVSSVNEAITVRSLAVGGGSRKVQLAGFEARWSPAAAMIGFLRRQGAENGGRIDIYRYDLNDLQLDQSSAGSNGQLVAGEVVISGSTLLPFNRLAASYTWSPNGREIAYSAVKDGRSSILKSSIGDQQPVELVIVAAANQLQSLKSPCWSPGGERIAYLIEERSGERQQSLWVNEQGKNVELYTGRERLRLVGWSETGREIYLALGEPKSSHLAVQPLRLIKVDVDSRRAAPLVVLPAAYLHNFSLSRDGRQIAFISRPENHDDIYLYSISQSRFKKLTDNREPRLYYAGLSWAPDGKQLCYGKQGSKSEVWMIEKFR